MKKSHLIILALVVGYLLIHLWNLTSLPVFADEAIYIRWAQLIIDDWQQYLFFPLNDGKTPLQIWLFVPFQYLFSDQLYAARFVAVLIGLLQMLLNGYLLKLLGGRKKYTYLVMLLTAVLPFWYFHHRMALIDALLTLTMTAAFTVSVLVQKVYSKQGISPLSIAWSLLGGVMFGLALLTKIPALLIIPILYLTVFLPFKSKLKITQPLAQKLSLISITVISGLVIFVLLKLHPAFGQLFNRGNDFLFPWQEVLLEGKWSTTIRNIPAYIYYFGSYLTWPILFLTIAGLFSNKHRRQSQVLFLAALGFAGPIALLGKVVYPRYLFPTVTFITVAATLGFQDSIDFFTKKSLSLTKKFIAVFILVSLLGQTLSQSSLFIHYSLTDSDQTPFVGADVEQYLTEWSSGHGIKQAAEYIQELATEQNRVAVGTEGSFGTLPDGLNMYLHRTDVTNIYVEGTGQYPIKDISGKFAERAVEYDQQLLVVNSHRIEIPAEKMTLLKEYCRPFDAPCLQIWDISELVSSDPVSEPSDSL
jgi:4-amino-4-deoxy-L-arabinose transferase-like glycosyltransferase